MTFKQTNRKSGFTLVELILYTAIVSMILSTMILITRSMYDTRARVRTSVLVREQLRFALSRITSSIREADSVSIPALGAQGSEIEMAMVDTDINPTSYSLSNGRIFIEQGTDGPVAITSSEVEITELTFERSSTEPSIIRIELSGDKRDAAGVYRFPVSLSSSVVLRRE